MHALSMTAKSQNDLISQPQGIVTAIPEIKLQDADQSAGPIVARFGGRTSAQNGTTRILHGTMRVEPSGER